MKKQDRLFHLIKSLTKGEKRYLKQLAAMQGAKDKRYLILFDFIEKQEEPNDQQIRDHFTDQAFVKQLHVLKNYLFSFIMKSLRLYQESHTHNQELRQLICEAEILIDKELFDSANEILKKVIRISAKYEKFEILLAAHRIQRQMLQATKGFVARDEISQIIAKEGKIITQLQNLNQYQELSYRFMETGPGDSNEDFLQEPLVKDDIKADSLQSQILYHHTIYAANSMSGQSRQGIASLDTLIGLLESQPHRIQEDPRSYITILNNKIGALLHTHNFEEIPGLLQKIRQVPDNYNMPPNRFKVKTLLSTYNVELELYRDTEQWKKGIELINEISSFIEQNASYITEEHKITFYYQFAYIFFKTNRLSEALKYLNELMTGKFEAIRTDIITYARFLYLIIHFELRNIIVLKYSVASCRRYFQKRRKLLHYEKTLLKFFSKLCTTPKSKWKELFEKLNTQLFLKATDSEKANILDYLNFESWIAHNLAPQRKAQTQ